ncbi:protein TIC 20-v, chloroplastic isoform X2 [Gossypium arboreum]|uniref:protein TIC 20-v, chloroplastic isoform X2 n=1 Tax=Gossypium arboreum TaxID=29729 RepID=UPI0008190F51|nr:protein TIC 20-v, chloroplastic isoform X2 [Gossypium arboreum]
MLLFNPVTSLSVPLTLSPKTHYSPSLSSLKNHPSFLTNKNHNPTRRKLLIVQAKGEDSADGPDRNPNFSRYVRFNTMQAIVLDVLLIFPDLLERSFNPKEGLGLDLVMSFDSTVFLYLLVSLIYASSSCLFGQLPRLPIVAEAADRQVL